MLPRPFGMSSRQRGGPTNQSRPSLRSTEYPYIAILFVRPTGETNHRVCGRLQAHEDISTDRRCSRRSALEDCPDPPDSRGVLLPTMPFSHHSHSGQFCDHASDTLEAMVQQAIRQRMSSICLTEHMPRERADFYPEEIDTHTEASLEALHHDFQREARRLRAVYADRIRVYIGFEGEWISPSSSAAATRALLSRWPDGDLFVGSVHHVHSIPIDFEDHMYQRAREIAGGDDRDLAVDYYDAQYEMLQTIRPPVVGHFDLIRLKSDTPDRDFRDYGPKLAGKVLRNLRFVAEYGGVLEINSSALRKGLKEPYPQNAIVRVKSTFQSYVSSGMTDQDSTGVCGLGWSCHTLGRQPWRGSGRSQLSTSD